MKPWNQNVIFLMGISIALVACQKDPAEPANILSGYSGTYKNIPYTTAFIKEFKTGTYRESEIPDEVKQLRYGRIEVSFRYDGGGSLTFMPLFYYGSVNKNGDDDAVEKTGFHLTAEIGHYKVIPINVDYLFYTISSFRQPLYCRDSWCPVIPGTDYDLWIDKKPEGIVLQLRKGDTIINTFPHAFFPDSTRIFFNEVTSDIRNYGGDSLQLILMVGKGFTGFDVGLHDFHGEVYGVRLFSYNLTRTEADYGIHRVKNQLTENQELHFSLDDPEAGPDRYIRLKYEYRPYSHGLQGMVPSGPAQTGQTRLFRNRLSQNTILNAGNVGFYILTPQTLDDQGNILKESPDPFEIWIYPREWYFDYY